VRSWLIHWLLKAVSILIVAQILPGIQVSGFGAAFIAAAVIAIASATLGLVLKVVLFPFAILTLGLVYLLVNGLMLKVPRRVVRIASEPTEGTWRRVSRATFRTPA